MKGTSLLAAVAAFAVLTLHAQQGPGPFDALAPQLGPAPWRDPSLPPPPPRALPKATIAVPAIDTTNQGAVIAAYNTYFNVSAPPLGFTGSVSACNPGAISVAYQNWMMARLNFLRAMAGVAGNVALDTSLNAQEQAAALIMSANGTLTHFPASTMTCWTQAGYNGASSSNLAELNQYFPDPVPLYMADYGTGNQIAGHRRWILNSPQTSFAIGQVTGGAVFDANALYVFGFTGTGSAPNGIPWPPRGYVPMSLIPFAFGSDSPRWSFGLPGADFTNATVTMTVNGAPLAVNVVSRTDNGYGDNTLVWELPSAYTVVKNSVYNVTINGIANASPTSFTYQVLPFDPADVPLVGLTVTLFGAGNGSVTSNPSGISCGATCTTNVASGSTVTLTANPVSGNVFAGWSGACSGTGACTVKPTAATNVGATFVPAASTATLYAVPPSIDFGGQSMATTSFPVAITVTNAGGQSATVSGVTITNAQFAQTNNCATLASGASCIVNVTFTPAVGSGALLSTVATSGTLSIASNATGSPNAVTLAGTAEKSLITHYYQGILGRAPDSGGNTFWQGETTRIANLGANINETWYVLAITFFNSAEYLARNRTDAQFVTDLYNTFFGRAPDASGLSYWTGQLASGMPREVLLASFMFSTEFTTFTQGIFGNTGVRAEINAVVDFYRGLLARLPDDSGFTFWVGQFRTAQCQGAGAVDAQADSISSGFINGAEYAGRNRTNAQYVGDLYNAFLRRGGDLAGVQYWISQLDSGAQTRDQLRQAFIASPEFQSRVSAIIAQGCM